LIVVLRRLGADISRFQKANAMVKQETTFYNHAKQKTETAFECRFYQNGNVHLKVNQALMTKFNVEVARIRGWVRGPKDIQNEFEVSEKEAAELWSKPSLVMLGPGDVPLFELRRVPDQCSILSVWAGEIITLPQKRRQTTGVFYGK
jgi:hypothetical protein